MGDEKWEKYPFSCPIIFSAKTYQILKRVICKVGTNLRNTENTKTYLGEQEKGVTVL